MVDVLVIDMLQYFIVTCNTYNGQVCILIYCIGQHDQAYIKLVPFVTTCSIATTAITTVSTTVTNEEGDG